MKLKRKLWITAISISTIVFFIVMTLFISTTNMDYGSNFSNSIDYSEMWTNKEIMVIVPHQDDEINLAGATIKRLIDNGNNVKVVFATNGDFKGLGTKRIKEAIEAVRILGVNSENVIFLGYGDQWEGIKKHIYNSDDNKIISSYIGKNETYGTDKYLDFRSSISGEPSSYTRGNYKNDMKDVIEMYFPDIIFAIDFDSHADHKSTSLIFEEAFCEVLRENKEYNPKVFKGFAYKTAWKAKDDFYGFNLESTLIPEKDSLINKNYDLDVPQYLWSERVRLPVAKEALSYTQNSNLVNKSLKAHKTQKASRRTVNIVNSDKVFWERETSSITYEAEVIASSGEFKYINDFKLIDSSNVNDIKLIDECVWIPDNEDNDKSFRINFASAKDIEKLVIYDNFSLEDNILDERGIKDKLIYNIYKSKFKTAHNKYPKKSKIIKTQMDILRNLEREESDNIDKVSNTFGELMGEIFSYKDDKYENDLRSIGFNIGKYIYILDAFEDLQEDYEKGRYNPFKEYINKIDDLIIKVDRLLSISLGLLSSSIDNLNLQFNRGIIENIVFSGAYLRYKNILKKGYERNV